MTAHERCRSRVARNFGWRDKGVDESAPGKRGSGDALRAEITHRTSRVMRFGAAADDRGRGLRVLDLLDRGPRNMRDNRFDVRLSGLYHGLGDRRVRCFDGSVANDSGLCWFRRAFLFCPGHGVGNGRACCSAQKCADDGFGAHLVSWFSFR